MKELKIHFLNTIWSDAILLENNNKYAFVDTGSLFYYPMINKHLNDRNITDLEFIILTHFHCDHYGNIINIINDYNVKTLYLKHYYGLDGTTSSGYDSNEEYIENEFKNYYNILDICKQKNVNVIYIDDLNEDMTTIKFDNINIELYDIKNTLYELYSNPSSLYYNQKRLNETFNSIAVFIIINKFNIFLGADMTCSKTDIIPLQNICIKVLNNIYNKHNINSIDIYKSCHHGGGSTNTKEMCELMKAKYCIITNTARWLDTYSTYDNLKLGNKDVNILPTDFQKYIFNINDNEITYDVIKEDSLFITLGKD